MAERLKITLYSFLILVYAAILMLMNPSIAQAGAIAFIIYWGMRSIDGLS